MTTIAKDYTDAVERAYKDVVALSKVCGGVTASIKSAQDVNVPNAMRGKFIVTGRGLRHETTNLARAVVILGAVYNCQNVWHETSTGRRRVIAQ